MAKLEINWYGCPVESYFTAPTCCPKNEFKLTIAAIRKARDRYNLETWHWDEKAPGFLTYHVVQTGEHSVSIHLYSHMGAWAVSVTETEQ